MKSQPSPNSLIFWVDMEEAVINMDAMDCQTRIAKQTVEPKGHYLLSVKTNRHELFEDMECAFKVNSGLTGNQQWEYDHVRFETRTCSILPARDCCIRMYPLKRMPVEPETEMLHKTSLPLERLHCS